MGCDVELEHLDSFCEILNDSVEEGTGEGDVGVHGMISCVERGSGEGVAAGVGFWGTAFVGAHGFVIPDFISLMGETEG